jgi:epoxyqueuosine reductase
MSFDPEAVLREMYDADADSHFEEPGLGRLFDPPVLGIASADDAWFQKFKTLLGDYYWTPSEALARVAPDATARSVISWCLPVSEPARRANRLESRAPAKLWAYVRTFGEHLNTRLRHGAEDRLRQLGFAALAPAVAEGHVVEEREGVGLSGCWSERHTAFVAGLGTFGISGGLITRRGIAHRLGSIVTDAVLEPTPRPYGDDPFAWCLRTAQGTCGACIARCPAGSIGETMADRDKTACATHNGAVYRECRESFGWDGTYGCGLCQTDVPCEDRNPVEDAIA